MEQAGQRALSSTLNRGLSGTARNTLPSRLLDDLLSRIVAIVGDKFWGGYAGANPDVFRQEWGAGLAGVTPMELERGLRELASQRFVPSLGEFNLWCRPYLDPEWSFTHARDCLMQRDKGLVGDWAHPAIWRAASDLSFEVRRGEYAPVRTRWKLAMERELAAGRSEVPPPPLRIESTHKPSNDSPAALAAREKLAKLRAEMGPQFTRVGEEDVGGS